MYTYIYIYMSIYIYICMYIYMYVYIVYYNILYVNIVVYIYIYHHFYMYLKYTIYTIQNATFSNIKPRCSTSGMEPPSRPSPTATSFTKCRCECNEDHVVEPNVLSLRYIKVQSVKSEIHKDNTWRYVLTKYVGYSLVTLYSTFF